MTSRVSFPKLLLETLRRHIAAVLITVLVFVIHLISFFLSIQNTLDIRVTEETVESLLSSSFYPNIENYKHIVERITEYCAPSFLNAVIALFIGGFLAFDFLRYMHSKRETDLYESMPIRKETWFGNLFTASLAVYLVPCLLAMGAELGVVYGFGFGSKEIAYYMLWNFITMFGTFLVGWTTTALAMTMTGHPIIAFLGVGVFSSYIPLVIAWLFPVYANKFFDTYVDNGISEAYFYFSPATLTYKATFYHNDIWELKQHWTYVLGCFVFAIVIGLITYLLFRKRPSETAGRAMAFEKINSAIRILLVVPLALYLGLFLGEISSYASTLWLIFGVLFGGALLHGVIECVFQFDIRALISKKRQLICTLIFCLGFVFVFWSDLFHYDDYEPEAKDLKSIQIHTYLFHDGNGYNKNQTDGVSGEYIEDALTAIRDIRATSPSRYDDEGHVYMNNFTVTYELKNGVKKQRRYDYYGNTFPESLDKLYATEALKDDYCVLYHLDELQLDSLSISNGVESKELKLSKEQEKAFCDTYLPEYTAMTLNEAYTNMFAYELQVMAKYTQDGEEFHEFYCYPVFENFTETIKLIESYGVKTFAQSDNLKLENLELWDVEYTENGKDYVSDEEMLNKLKPYMTLTNFKYRDDYGKEGDYYYCNLRYEINKETQYTNVYIKKSDFKQIVKP